MQALVLALLWRIIAAGASPDKYKLPSKCTCLEERICSATDVFRKDDKNIVWASLLSEYPLDHVYSAPAHSNLRSPPKVLQIAEGLCRAGGIAQIPDEYKAAWQETKVWIDVSAVAREDGKLVPCHVELRDGNHRLVAAMMAGASRIGDLIKDDFIKVSLNGDWPADRESVVPTQDESWPRWVPLAVGKEAVANCPDFTFKEVGGDRGVPDAEVPKDFTSINRCLTTQRGAPLSEVVTNTMASLDPTEISNFQAECKAAPKPKPQAVSSTFDWFELMVGVLGGGLLVLIAVHFHRSANKSGPASANVELVGGRA